MGRRGPRAGSSPGGTTAAHATAVGNGRAPTMPRDLPAGARREWQRIAPELALSGLLCEKDLAILESYVRHFDLWHRAIDALDDAAAGSPEQRNLAAVAKEFHGQLIKACGELGLTPNARARIKLEGPATTKSELDQFEQKTKR